MADDNDNSSEKENINYVRKKNLIPGWDNDHLILAGLGVLAALGIAPYAKQFVDNFLRNLPQYQNQGQRPPNGMQQQGQQQQPMYLPPETQQPQPQQPIPEQQVQANALQEHEHAIAEQKAYEAAVEKEQITGSQGINMVPDRSTQVSKPKKGQHYEAGSNISGSYS